MQNNTQHFIGIDVSKLFFDAALMPVINYQKQAMDSAHFENTELGLKSFEKWLRSHKVSFDQNTILVVENTGIYHRLLWAFCNKINLQIHIGIMYPKFRTEKRGFYKWKPIIFNL